MDGQAVVRLFRQKGKQVLTFLGFGELGYEDPRRVRELMIGELSARSAARFLVNSGTLIREGGHNGIADVYPLAKELGFETTGIHPSIALDHHQTHSVSPYVDQAFFVHDESWGGCREDGHPSPTLRTLLEVSHTVIVIGGGKHAAEEMEWFSKTSIPVTFHAAEMNHAMASEWTKSAGIQLTGFDGAASRWWRARTPP